MIDCGRGEGGHSKVSFKQKVKLRRCNFASCFGEDLTDQIRVSGYFERRGRMVERNDRKRFNHRTEGDPMTKKR
ncbi:hypothetical protein L1987_60532 [Smallanthus sonchifolius]|uniref:Uncharacterized protein n=1 Tax=Smallanthus sonchifolius TaxID=185202 RepID=A0ACB9D8N2_9ASTR|nr:hypothetical protein L1987_60532 [Smallanthus sonchifolius]